MRDLKAMPTPLPQLDDAAIMVSVEMDSHVANRSETPSSAARRFQADENAAAAAAAVAADA